MPHYNRCIDLWPSTILHAASASHCDTCWQAPWCENIRVPASLPCKKRAWITVLRRQWSSWINPPAHHTNLAVSIKLDFLIAGGDLHCAQPWVRYYRHSAVHTAEMMPRSCGQEKLEKALSGVCVRRWLVTPTRPAARGRVTGQKQGKKNPTAKTFASSWFVLNINRANTPFHYFMITK